MMVAKQKNAHKSLIIDPTVLGFQTKLQKIMGWEYSTEVRFDIQPLLQGQQGYANLKVFITCYYWSYCFALWFLRYRPENLPIRTPQMKTISWTKNLPMWTDLTWAPPSRLNEGSKKLESTCNLLIIEPRGLGCETNLSEIMDLESSDVVRFDLGPRLQSQLRVPKFKRAVFPVDTFSINSPMR